MSCVHPFQIKNPKYDKRRPVSILNPEFFTVPCGKCGLCLQHRRDQWRFRLEAEANNSTSGYFITLTYDDSHIPMDSKPSKRHLQLFLKKFRKRISGHHIKYFVVSEYGEQTERLHYHMLLFDYPGSYNHLIKDLQRTWQYCDPEHFTYPGVIGLVTPSSIAYVCKYCLNTIQDLPLTRDEILEHEIFGTPLREVKRNIMLCSKGIGKSYLTPAMEYYLQQQANGQGFINQRFRSLPRYYRDKVYDDEMKLKIYEKGLDYYEQNLEKDLDFSYQHPGERDKSLLQQRNERKNKMIIFKTKNNKGKI